MMGLPAGPGWWMGNEWCEWVSWAKLTPSDPCSEVLTYRPCGPFLPFTLTMPAQKGKGQQSLCPFTEALFTLARWGGGSGTHRQKS